MKCENCLFVYNEGGYVCKFFDRDTEDICTEDGCKPKFTELLKLERLRDKYDSGESDISRKYYNLYRERLIKKYGKQEGEQTMKKLSLLQKELDIKKYIDSEYNNKDLCGTYDYCKYCDKKNKYPCAKSFNKFRNAL